MTIGRGRVWAEAEASRFAVVGIEKREMRQSDHKRFVIVIIEERFGKWKVTMPSVKWTSGQLWAQRTNPRRRKNLYVGCIRQCDTGFPFYLALVPHQSNTFNAANVNDASGICVLLIFLSATKALYNRVLSRVMLSTVSSVSIVEIALILLD